MIYVRSEIQTPTTTKKGRDIAFALNYKHLLQILHILRKICSAIALCL